MFNDLQQRLCVCVFVCRIHGRIGASERASERKQAKSESDTVVGFVENYLATDHASQERTRPSM